MIFNPYDYDENTVMKVESFEEDEHFRQFMDTVGLKPKSSGMWRDHDKWWDEFDGQIGHRFLAGSYGSLMNGVYCFSKKYKIISYKDFEFKEDEVHEPPDDFDERFTKLMGIAL